MTKLSQIFLLCVCVFYAVGNALAEVVDAQSYEVSHEDVLTVNPNLQLSDVLESAYARAPVQASLRSRDVMVLAKNRVANATLPSTPAVSVTHQTDAVGSGRGERDKAA
ncbi:MAG: hypothetical protein B7Y34_06555 [Methylophilales bacterium 16-45-9]|nr:MAG: hypothetical protein B7Y34_06555 [Methylophilales bacterium 16-45-9]